MPHPVLHLLQGWPKLSTGIPSAFPWTSVILGFTGHRRRQHELEAVQWDGAASALQRHKGRPEYLWVPRWHFLPRLRQVSALTKGNVLSCECGRVCGDEHTTEQARLSPRGARTGRRETCLNVGGLERDHGHCRTSHIASSDAGDDRHGEVRSRALTRAAEGSKAASRSGARGAERGGGREREKPRYARIPRQGNGRERREAAV